MLAARLQGEETCGTGRHHLGDIDDETIAKTGDLHGQTYWKRRTVLGDEVKKPVSM